MKHDDLRNSIHDDPINHPKHYCREGGMECPEEMELSPRKEPYD